MLDIGQQQTCFKGAHRVVDYFKAQREGKFGDNLPAAGKYY